MITIENKETIQQYLLRDMKMFREMIEGCIDSKEHLILQGSLLQAEKMWADLFQEVPPTPTGDSPTIYN